MTLPQKIGIIGVGNMGRALVQGWLKARLIQPQDLWLADADTAKTAALSAATGARTAGNRETAMMAEVLILAVKPQVVPTVIEEIQAVIPQGRLLISIAAGITLAFLGENLPQVRLVRVMPNTPTLVQAGMAAITAGPTATATDLELVQSLFGAVGRTVVVPENLLDAVTGLSGCGPAYVFLFLEALADGGVKMGLPRETALLLAAQTIYGSAALALETRSHPGVLKDGVTSPGGATIAGLHVLEQGGWRGLIMSAVEAAAKRSQELGRPPAKPS